MTDKKTAIQLIDLLSKHNGFLENYVRYSKNSFLYRKNGSINKSSLISSVFAWNTDAWATISFTWRNISSNSDTRINIRNFIELVEEEIKDLGD